MDVKFLTLASADEIGCYKLFARDNQHQIAGQNKKMGRWLKKVGTFLIAEPKA